MASYPSALHARRSARIHPSRLRARSQRPVDLDSPFLDTASEQRNRESAPRVIRGRAVRLLGRRRRHPARLGPVRAFRLSRSDRSQALAGMADHLYDRRDGWVRCGASIDRADGPGIRLRAGAPSPSPMPWPRRRRDGHCRSPVYRHVRSSCGPRGGACSDGCIQHPSPRALLLLPGA